MSKSSQEEQKHQLLLGVAFSSAAMSVMVALVFKLGYCCEWFGMHHQLS